MNNKKIIIGAGVLVLLGVGYYIIKNKAQKPFKVKKDGDATVYVVIKGKKHAFPNPTSYLNFGISEVKVIPKSELDLIPNGQNVEESGKIAGESGSIFDPANYTAKSKDESFIYLVRNGKKHFITNPTAHLNYLWSEITTLPKDELDLIPSGGNVDVNGKIPNGV
jgi:hypothetical protein